MIAAGSDAANLMPKQPPLPYGEMPAYLKPQCSVSAHSKRSHHAETAQLHSSDATLQLR